MCVQICPTGIDIRNGLQYGCIVCAACINACNAIMNKIGAVKRFITRSKVRGLRHRDECHGK